MAIYAMNETATTERPGSFPRQVNLILQITGVLSNVGRDENSVSFKLNLDKPPMGLRHTSNVSLVNTNADGTFTLPNSCMPADTFTPQPGSLEPSSFYPQYMSEFLNLNPQLVRWANSVGIDITTLFVVDTLNSYQLICLVS